MVEMNANQQQLIEMIVDKVLKKHKVKMENNTLTEEEKEEIRNVVEKIKRDVERFLKNQTQTKTEKDFQAERQTAQQRKTSGQRIFTSPNDVRSVKRFYPKRS